MKLVVNSPVKTVAMRRVAAQKPSSASHRSLVVLRAKNEAEENMDKAQRKAEETGDKLREGVQNFKEKAWDQPLQGIAESTAAGIQAAKENVTEGTLKQTKEGFQSAQKAVSEDAEKFREGGPGAMADRVKERVEKKDGKGL